jgi:hypothetical protein
MLDAQVKAVIIDRSLRRRSRMVCAGCKWLFLSRSGRGKEFGINEPLGG